MSTHIAMHDPFRPKKLVHSDRSEFITQESEVQFRAINAAGTCQLIARAEISQFPSTNRWQLRRIIYDQNGLVTAILWPLTSKGLPTRDYRFNWGAALLASVTNISQGTTCQVTAQNNFAENDLVYFEGLLGMTQLNFTGQNLYKVVNVSSSGFVLSGVDSSNYSAYQSGGTAFDYPALQYTFG